VGGLGISAQRSCYGGYVSLMVLDDLDWRLGGGGTLDEAVNHSGLS
jgi:hypothetical protein